ncbi:hypothetical protein KY310_01525 [Candidatus Woesearchaeota archaeon]|nr:hypothetical protein [Candidatus Woesearchaeota archaeon]
MAEGEENSKTPKLSAEEIYQLEKVMQENRESKMICPDLGINDMSYPVEVSDISFGPLGVRPFWHGKTGSFVAIRPVGEEYGNKTYLGILLGEIPVNYQALWHPETKKLQVSAHFNPAIYVPDLETIIFGNSSWWGPIKSPEHLRKITDEDIQNVWYVKALKQLSERIEQEDKK